MTERPFFRTTEHESVMVSEVLADLALRDGDMVVDCTAGVGGHSAAMLAAANIRLIALDADPAAVENVTARLGSRAKVVEANFRDLDHVLSRESVASADKFLFDLGWNRGQLFAGRGFSLLAMAEPLNMSYGEEPASGFTARDIVNTWSEEMLANAIYGYGEETRARRVASAIVAAREKGKLETVGDLIAAITPAFPAVVRRGRTHFATKTFQALRMAVNDELGSIDKGLRAAWRHLTPGGRIAVITFHSIEDRAVKRLFAEFAGGGGEALHKKPLAPSRAEIDRNPSARSAKLRTIIKTKAA